MKYQLLALSLAVVCGLRPAAAVQPKPADIYVSVVDKQGEPALALTAEDFRVREDNVAREILKVGPATEPMTVALLVDDTASADPVVQMIREAVDDFIVALDGKAEIGVFTFGDRPTIQVEYTTDQKKLREGAKRIFPRSNAGSYLLDAFVEVSRGLAKREAKRPVIVVLAMDQDVEFSNRHYTNVLDEIVKSRAALHTVLLGRPSDSLTDETRNRNQVVAIGTERTGGRRDNVLSATSAATRMKQLARELTNQYVVTYSRPETLIPPEKVDVTVTKPGLTARARTRNPQAGSK